MKQAFRFRLLSASEIPIYIAETINNSRKRQDNVASIENPTFENTVQVLADDEAKRESEQYACCFPSQVSPDLSIRNASTEADKKYEEFKIESSMREDVYRTLLRYKKNGDIQTRDQGSRRLLDKMLETFERNGLDLADERVSELREMKKNISNLCIDFQKNVSENNITVEFTTDELEGLPGNFIDNLPTVSDETNDLSKKFRVSLKIPHVLPILKYAVKEETRKKINQLFDSQCLETNLPILDKIIELRQKSARLLGRETYSDYILEVRMAKNIFNVSQFLNDLRNKLKPLALEEKEKLLFLREKETGFKDSELNIWDFQYYARQLVESEYKIDQNQIKEYFPIEFVTENLLQVYQDVLGLCFKQIQDENIWHEDVLRYEVYDAENKNFIGTFYLDLYPREGKFPYAAVFPLQPLHILDYSIQYPAAVLITNFTKSEKDRPSLLRHDEVITYFHEFGHIMHHMCSNVAYSRFSGTNVEQDFVEAPSQMLENWCWEPEVLHKISRHYLTGEHLPDTLIQKMIAARNACTGLLNLKQIFLATFDLTLHSLPIADEVREKTNSGDLWHKLYTDITLINCPRDTNPAARFNHLTGGYESQYYSYLYSQVFAADMFSNFKNTGVMSPVLGKKYRDVILAPGGSVDSIESLRLFLGREPNNEAFLRNLGL
jgi:Zn-dependent oligopeptidase